MQTPPPLNWRKSNLPRLAPEFYRGFAFVFWTHAIEERCTGWLSAEFHSKFREILLHACARYKLSCPVYCLMPDHIHLIWLGASSTSDQQLATRFLRKHVALLLCPARLQKQPHDHVLRELERERGAFQSTCFYIQENPVRKGLVDDWAAYPYTDCMFPGYPELEIRSKDYWQHYWRAYNYQRTQNEIAAQPSTLSASAATSP